MYVKNTSTRIDSLMINTHSCPITILSIPILIRIQVWEYKWRCCIPNNVHLNYDYIRTSYGHSLDEQRTNEALIIVHVVGGILRMIGMSYPHNFVKTARFHLHVVYLAWENVDCFRSAVHFWYTVYLCLSWLLVLLAVRNVIPRFGLGILSLVSVAMTHQNSQLFYFWSQSLCSTCSLGELVIALNILQDDIH